MKHIILVVLCLSIASVGGLLRLHNGQIQQEVDGEWQCADAEIRKIVNSDYITVNGNTLFWNNTALEYKGKYIIEIEHYDPNCWTIPDSFIKSMCESGRVCEVIGHTFNNSNDILVWDEDTKRWEENWYCTTCRKWLAKPK